MPPITAHGMPMNILPSLQIAFGIGEEPALRASRLFVGQRAHVDDAVGIEIRV